VKNQKIDPLILAAVCEFAYQVLTSEAGLKDITCIENVLISLKKLVPLLGYMKESSYEDLQGFDKYRHVCEKAEIYQKGTIIDNKPVSLEQMHNPVVHRLFIAIIKLITFVSKYANKKHRHISKICREYSSLLNEHAREIILFKCLKIPTDEVKIVVMECLVQINIMEIDPDELAQFVRLLTAYNNIGAGKVIEVTL